MFRSTNFLTLLIVLGLFATGCQNNPNPVEPQNSSYANLSANAKLPIPAGATLESATLHIYVSVLNNRTIDVHRVTSDWIETTVTWNNFGGSYAPEVFGSFVADAVAWRTVDVTSLVQGWLDGSYDNYGLLLDQVDKLFPRARYDSRESGIRPPFLEICYMEGDVQVCDTLFSAADSYIWQVNPNTNYGTSTVLYTGWENDADLEKQSLVRFDIPVAPPVAAIGDFVWSDMNMNGIQDAGEPGVAGVTVNLYDCQNVFIASTTTDADGYYLFGDLTPGDYYVEFVLPSGYVFSPMDQGSDDAMDSDADMMTGKTMCTTLDDGETDLTWDAGIYMPVMDDGCTLTIGYWKTHAGFGPQDDMVTALLPIWLGTDGGAKSLAVTTAAIAVDVLNQNVYGIASNGVTKLYAQLLGAKLNIANGASDSEVADVISAADAFLANYNWMDWGSLSKADQKMVLGWKDMLDDYNNGYIGPGHCEE